jgi:hypothetical protein
MGQREFLFGQFEREHASVSFHLLNIADAQVEGVERLAFVERHLGQVSQSVVYGWFVGETGLTAP